MKGTDHRRKTSRNRYAKGRRHYDRHPSKKIVKGKRGSLMHAPGPAENPTLGSIWP